MRANVVRAVAVPRLWARYAGEARLIAASGLFDTSHYLSSYPDVAAARRNPFFHFLKYGWKEGRNPNPLFDTQWYLSKYSDVAAAGLNPVSHYIRYGAKEGRDPSALFSTSWYLQQYPDVATAGLNPLSHYLKYGQAEGRQPRAPSTIMHPQAERMANLYAEVGDLNASTLLALHLAGPAALQRFFQPNWPLNVVIDHRLNAAPRLRILLPSVKKRHATGGPNTAYLLGAFLAREGTRVTFVSTDIELDDDLGLIKRHLKDLTGIDPDAHGIAFEDASDRSVPYAIGINDMLVATAWWTAYAAAAAMRLTRASRFYYLVQDYETLFYSASEKYADAESSYSLPCVPIINTSLLRDHLVERRVGHFADAEFANSALVFEPAVDDSKFYPTQRQDGQPQRLLFYARPTVAERNLFGLGVAALKAAVRGGHFGDRGWEFLGMGEQFDPIDLGRGYVLKPAPWHDLEAYAAQMRSADVLLSLMLSPHPSYPPLEMAACGGVSVTTTFGSKSAERLRQISPNIIGVLPRIEDLVNGLARAVTRSAIIRGSGASDALGGTTWQKSLSQVTAEITQQLLQSGCVEGSGSARLPAPKSFVRTQDVEGSPAFYSQRLNKRRKLYREGSSDNLLSLVTTVYDTDAQFLYDLAHSVFGQDTKLEFEWLILDNGSSNLETLEALDRIGQHPCVRLERVERNLGIVGGMRWCLENAKNRYILPLDSDDLLFPDCLRTITAHLEQTGFPLVVYTNEDKTDGTNQVEAYIKPAWDPVLFIHSCYIAHLTVINRRKAIELGCYGDAEAEGCHDWDTFARFMAVGIEPSHLSEVLYSWRMHPGSTSSNYKSKSYIYGSHHFVLERFLATRSQASNVAVTPAPLFNGTPDYRFAPKVPTHGDQSSGVATVRLSSTATPAELIAEIGKLSDDVSRVHLLASDCEPTDDGWRAEADTLFGLFSDCVIVGGRIHDAAIISEAGYVFGYGGGIGCPDAGRAVRDPGYFAQMWKPRSVAAVSARHCVVERTFLTHCLSSMPADVSVSLLGPWLGARAARAGKRVIYSPYVEAVAPRGQGLSVSEIRQFNGEFGNLSNNLVGYAEHLDRSGTAPYQPKQLEPELSLTTYGDYFSNRMTLREDERRSIGDEAPTITIITTVYKNTDTALFVETANSVRNQTRAPVEWLILAHGPIPDELLSTLESLVRDGVVRLLQTHTNLGIHGGLRYCLERAVGDFVISLDADDLLTPDAIEILTAATISNPHGEIFYSDEDHLIEGVQRYPYYRPDFDPALLFSHSYVWHAILYRRSTALQLGVYTREDAEYAVDWDTLVRFYLAGHAPDHIQEVLYHWRQHRSSLSNSGKTFEGSLRSIQGVLESIADAKDMNSRLVVARYPAEVGSPDFYLRRLPIDPPGIDLVCFGRSSSSPNSIALPEFPFRSVISSELLRGFEGIKVLREEIGKGESEFVMFLGQALAEIDSSGLWQAIKHLELIDECAAVGGCLVDFEGAIVSGAPVLIDQSTLVDPLVGASFNSAGHFSLALKPHSVDALSPDILIARRTFVQEALACYPSELGLRSFGLWLGVFAAQKSMTLTYEPLLRGFVTEERLLVGDPVEGLNRAIPKIGEMQTRASGLVTRGYASFRRHSNLHG